ncbi:MAG: hypothetical protein HC838_08865 [Spirulinaceae cyanobacterium RM2_2_10]|nr:hypothetical protein [Spirulinaceae cyanobacterium RM2_2_10]
MAGKTDAPVYKVVLYGRLPGESRPAWIEPIDLASLRAQPPLTASTAIAATTPATALATSDTARTPRSTATLTVTAPPLLSPAELPARRTTHPQRSPVT